MKFYIFLFFFSLNFPLQHYYPDGGKTHYENENKREYFHCSKLLILKLKILKLMENFNFVFFSLPRLGLDCLQHCLSRAHPHHRLSALLRISLSLRGEALGQRGCIGNEWVNCLKFIILARSSLIVWERTSSEFIANEWDLWMRKLHFVCE